MSDTKAKLSPAELRQKQIEREKRDRATAAEQAQEAADAAQRQRDEQERRAALSIKENWYAQVEETIANVNGARYLALAKVIMSTSQPPPVVKDILDAIKRDN